MKIGEINERALVAHIAGLLANRDSNVIAGAGEDDCAVLDIGTGDFLVVTTDMLHRKTDFPERMTGWQIGWMSVAVNLSDLASKGARPVGVVMAMGLPADTELSFVDELVKGMDDCAKRFGTGIIGGDTDSHDELTITGTALGVIRKEALITRGGAHPKDIVCVTGYCGCAGAALYALSANADASDEIMKTLFEPVPRIYEGIKLAATDAVTSMMDTSDGLAMSLHDLGIASNVGFRIYENKLPVHPDVKNLVSGGELLEMALYSGGDFELLFTVAPDKFELVKNKCDLTVIGEVTDSGIIIEKTNGIEKVKARGYGHFGN
ncbi:MAG: thiamine-phosphate kinase [Candidatus Methanoperedens sp.]|jgi:thiamine-monophosphate kinase|nr:thiamine-phosphate kinase [Candidatus Methanoperedens sp.]PKL53847.1 MAG: thiamine-phosphate kinase [Candidatus Methanoperedenaceae archaeon HGW-Methanoperedenaceae-1]